MTGPQKHRNLPGQGREDRLIRELVHDPYKLKFKYPEPTLCPGCGAVFDDGRWQWSTVPEGTHEALCPACLRIRDKVPAAFLTVRGKFFQSHRDEIMHLIRNVEKKENQERPLERIMNMEEADGELAVTFTDPHLARAVGEALYHAYKGHLDYHYEKGEVLFRVRWER
ncbi:MAG TPA: ATPase [Sedimenticola sp.]|nr:ATPase [Sedimenticola sp.]